MSPLSGKQIQFTLYQNKGGKKQQTYWFADNTCGISLSRTLLNSHTAPDHTLHIETECTPETHRKYDLGSSAGGCSSLTASRLGNTEECDWKCCQVTEFPRMPLLLFFECYTQEGVLLRRLIYGQCTVQCGFLRTFLLSLAPTSFAKSLIHHPDGW